MFGQGHRLNQQEADVINSILDQEERNLDDFNNSSATLSLLDDQCRQIWPNWDTFSPRDTQKSSVPPQRETVSTNYRPTSFAKPTSQPQPNKYAAAPPKKEIPQIRDYQPPQPTKSINTKSPIATTSISSQSQTISRQTQPSKTDMTSNFELQNIKADIDNLFSKIQSISSGNSSPSSSPKVQTGSLSQSLGNQPSIKPKYDLTSPATKFNSKPQSSVLQSPATEFRNAHKDPSFTYQPPTQSSFSFDMNSSIPGYMNAPSFDMSMRSEIDDINPKQSIRPQQKSPYSAKTSIQQYQPQKSTAIPPKSPNNFDIPISPKQYNPEITSKKYGNLSAVDGYDDSMLGDNYMSSSNLYDLPASVSSKVPPVQQRPMSMPPPQPQTSLNSQFSMNQQFSTNQQFTQRMSSEQRYSEPPQMGTPRASGSATAATTENEELVRLRTDNFMLRTELMKVKKRLQIEELERKRLEDALEKSGKLIEYYKQQMTK